ncbi:MAG TPA: hypothetical protein VFI65_20470 [Streptosporangiaceae bacterium]|nr:hypothetical protein [Streptosporangiaceae bacterium]
MARGQIRMDELELVRKLFAEPVPPAPEVVEDAYARMMSGGEGGWARRSRNGAIVIVAAASLAAAAITAVALASRVSRTSPPPPGHQVTNKPALRPLPSAKDVLLTAAKHVPPAPTTGRYWRLRTMTFTIRAGGTKAHPYNLLQAVSHDEWYPVDPSQRYWDIGQVLGAQPQTAVDVRAWRAAGAPRTWRVAPGKAPASIVSSAPSPRTYSSTSSSKNPAAPMWNVATASTFGQLQQLPSTVASLRAFLEQAAKANPIPGDAVQQLTLFDECVFVLNDPVSAQVKRAAFEILAELPGTRVVAKVTDPLGHSFYELVHAERSGTVIFVDSRHGRVTGLHYDEPASQRPWPYTLLWLSCKKGFVSPVAVRTGQAHSYLRNSKCKLAIPVLYGRPYDGLLDVMTYWVSSGFTNASPPVPHSR